jgi:hypothetical protein
VFYSILKIAFHYVFKYFFIFLNLFLISIYQKKSKKTKNIYFKAEKQKKKINFKQSQVPSSLLLANSESLCLCV